MDTDIKPNINDEKKGIIKYLIALFLLLLLAGTVVSVELTRIHFKTHTDSSFQSICALSKVVNCETVAKSQYAVFAGLPVAVWGLAAYLFMTIFLLVLLKKVPARPFLNVLFSVVSIIFLAVAAVLAYVSHFIIGSLCIFCASLYLINFLMTAVSVSIFILSKESFKDSIINDLKTLWQLKVPTIITILSAVAFVVLLIILIPPYWEHNSWSDIPVLNSGVDSSGHHYIGADNPKLTILEFSDYQCPICRFSHKNIRMLVAPYADKVRLIHRHFPLDRHCNSGIKLEYHDRACEFSFAAECAALQNDSFWKMNDAIFSIQESVDAKDVNLESISKSLNLNFSKLKDCINNNVEVHEKIQKDILRGDNLKLPGTPVYYLGNVRKPGGFTEEDLLKALDIDKN
ncbi:MAG: thioredoxin domain-containing protein [Deltaproteobacteria bacterium]|nr:thioredoxin domain-containing protein [Deltaproteobacteria bacterium]